MTEVRQAESSEAMNGGLVFVQTILASIGGLLALLYAAGFVVVDTYLLDHGLVDPGLADATDLSVGACFVILVCLTMVPVASSMYLLCRAIFQFFEDGGRIANLNTIRWRKWIMPAFWVFPIVFGLAVVLPVRIILLVAQTGTGAEALHYSENLSLFLSTLWHLLRYWFMPICSCGLFLGEALALGGMAREVVQRIGKSDTERRITIVSNQPETRRRDRK